jgi:ubiquinone/menaquinone biosynthesis C-methylase UbiE
MDSKEPDIVERADGDQAQEAEQRYINYLSSLNAVEFIQTYKRQTYNLMEIEQGHRILDVGCGIGDDVLAMAEMVGPSGQVIGIDNSETRIGEARKRSQGLHVPAEFRIGNIYHLDEADNVFDGCRSDRVFHELVNGERAFAEMVRVTRPGGRIVICDVDWETLVIDAPNRAVTRKIVNLICDNFGNGWAARHLFRYFKQAGLVDVAVTPMTAILHEYVMADQGFGLSATAEAAQAAGDISETEAADWLHYLKNAGETGDFFCSITGYHVSGRRPI